MKYGRMRQHGWALSALHQVKEAVPKEHTVAYWTNLICRTGKSIGTERRQWFPRIRRRWDWGGRECESNE